MLEKSTIQLLRYPFSFFLMPVFWFALSMVQVIDWPKAALIFFVLHFLLFPSGNGYNSYMDRDETSIGGLEKPLQPTKQLFYITILLDIAAIFLAYLISNFFLIGTVCYILCSRAYSYRGIRLKRYPILGYLTVVLNQGSLIFLMVYLGAAKIIPLHFQWMLIASSAFLIGGFYPITQIYQHEADRKDQVTTLSILLGIRGTFVYCAIMYLVAFGLLFIYWIGKQQIANFVILQVFFLPVIFFFFRWMLKVWNNSLMANFKNTMQMNVIASFCTNLAFILLLIIHQFWQI